MTKKDFEMIAAAFRDVTDRGVSPMSRRLLADVAGYIADGCKADNPRFNRRRFLQACGFDA